MRFSDLLVDLAAVAGASRAIASKHVALRGRQIDRYRKTSSIIGNGLGQQKAAQPPPSPSNVGDEVQKTPVVVNQEPMVHQADEPTPPTDFEMPSFSVRVKSRSRPVDVAPSQHTRQEVPRVADLENSNATHVPAFVPAPWANSHLGTLHQTFTPPKLHDAVPRSHGIPDTRNMESVPAGINLDVFRTGKVADVQQMPILEERKSSATATPMLKPGQETHASDTAGDRTAPDALTATPETHQAPIPKSEEIKPKITQDDVDAMADLVGDSRASYQLRESKVPSSRLGRIWNYSGLAVGMFAGAIGEGLSRAVGGGGEGSMMLSAANMERLVAKLSRMRGAALKLGQMISIQDTKMLPGPLQEVLQRVQDRADYMPAWQRDRVLATNLGTEWRELFDEFEEKPIAAASIGQVHRATLKSNGAKVAVKIQFPGVADSINSDLDNLSILLSATSLLPKGLYLNKTIDNARIELGWECDYEREAACAQRYRELLAGEEDIFQVPQIYPEACGKQVLTMEYMDGVGVTRVKSFDQQQRDWIGTQILRLCLREVTEFKFMQTDPNWTNFQYNAATNKLELLDFGASREYPDRFIGLYVRLLEAASRADRAAVKTLSEELGYLTGHESRTMLDAHITSILTLAEPFLQTAPEVYDFRDQTITDRVKEQIPVMIRERLAPPPEETYSLHRKLSGAFLLCARLGSQVRCREMFEQAVKKTDYFGQES